MVTIAEAYLSWKHARIWGKGTSAPLEFPDRGLVGGCGANLYLERRYGFRRSIDRPIESEGLYPSCAVFSPDFLTARQGGSDRLDHGSLRNGLKDLLAPTLSIPLLSVPFRVRA